MHFTQVKSKKKAKKQLQAAASERGIGAALLNKKSKSDIDEDDLIPVCITICTHAANRCMYYDLITYNYCILIAGSCPPKGSVMSVVSEER